MLHHGEEYYEIGKRTRNTLDDVMRGLMRRNQLSKEAAAIQWVEKVLKPLSKPGFCPQKFSNRARVIQAAPKCLIFKHFHAISA